MSNNCLLCLADHCPPLPPGGKARVRKGEEWAWGMGGERRNAAKTVSSLDVCILQYDALCMTCVCSLRPFTRGVQGGEKFSMGKFLPGKIPPGKNSATIVKSDGKNCATLFHGEGQGLRSALLIEGDTT